MTEKLPVWVQQARRLPLAFAQVREDPRIDAETVRLAGKGARVLMIASGGCTAAYLAASGDVSQLHCIDPNPAQLALARLKVRLLSAESARRLALLGHAPMSADERYEAIAKELATHDLPVDAFGPPELWAAEGPDHAGRYERCFAALRERLRPFQSEIESLLRLSNPAKQSELAAPTAPLGQAIDAALDEAMALPNLVGLFGEQATRNPRQEFSRHFAERTRHVLGTMDAASNPWIRQMYLGRFPERVPYPWFDAAARPTRAVLGFTNTDMRSYLESTRESYDVIHLSNILDWLSADDAAAILEHAARRLRPSGCVLIRQLNSTLDIPPLGPAFAWNTEWSERQHSADRSFFYRHLHLGVRR